MDNDRKEKGIRLIDDNRDEIKKYFEDRKWSEEDLKQTEWT